MSITTALGRLFVHRAPYQLNKCIKVYTCYSTNISKKSEINSEHHAIKNEKVKPPFAKNLFLGKFDCDVLTFPEVLEHDQLQTLDNRITSIEHYFSSEVDSKLIDASASISEEIMTNLKDLGLFGQQIPVQYGGLGLNATEYARVGEITSLDGSIAVMLSAHQTMGLKGILLAGNEEQKQRYLPQLAKGDWLAAFCLTEHDSGSDLTMIQTRAKLSENGKLWYLSGNKIWISNGGLANLFTVIAKTEVEDHLGNKEEKLTAFLVERDFDGVSSGEPEDKLGVRGSNTSEVHFENTPIPVENVLGEVGDGFKIALHILNGNRFTMGSTSAGVLKKLIGLATEHSINRKQFGKQLIDFDLTQEKIAKITYRIYAMESMTYLAAGMLDSYENLDTDLEAAIVKVFSSENLWNCVCECQQMFGAIGFMKKHPYERILRDSRLAMILEGTNEVLRMSIALTGLQYAGMTLKESIDKLRNPLKNPGFIFNKVLEKMHHSRDVPKLTLGLDGYVHPSLQNSAKQLEYCVLRLQYAVEILLARYGHKITEPQMELNRLTDIVISIYAMTAVIGRSSRSYCVGLQDSDFEVLVAATFCLDAFQNVKAIVKDIEVGPVITNDMNYKRIAQKVLKKKGYFPIHPLSRNF